MINIKIAHSGGKGERGDGSPPLGRYSLPPAASGNRHAPSVLRLRHFSPSAQTSRTCPAPPDLRSPRSSPRQKCRSRAGRAGIPCCLYSITSNTDFGNNLSLNHTTKAGTSLTLTPAFSKFNRSEIAKIKLLHSDRRTWANFFCKYSGRQ